MWLRQHCGAVVAKACSCEEPSLNVDAETQLATVVVHLLAAPPGGMQEHETIRQYGSEADLKRNLSRALLHFQDRLLEANITPGSLCQVRREVLEYKIRTSMNGCDIMFLSSNGQLRLPYGAFQYR